MQYWCRLFINIKIKKENFKMERLEKLAKLQERNSQPIQVDPSVSGVFRVEKHGDVVSVFIIDDGWAHHKMTFNVGHIDELIYGLKHPVKEVQPAQEERNGHAWAAVPEDVPAEGLEERNLHRYFICSIDKVNNIVRDIINIPYIVQDPQSFTSLENDWRNHKKDPDLTIISFNLLKIEQVVYYDNKPLKEDDIEVIGNIHNNEVGE